MVNQKNIILLCFILLIFGCRERNSSSSESIISETATAVRKNDGTIETREANQKEINDLNQAIQRHKDLNKKFPGPLKHEELSSLTLYKVKSVSANGTISLETGPIITPEGVSCSSKGLSYIAKYISGENNRIAFLPSSENSSNEMPAYIWLANLSLMEDPELKNFIKGPSYSSLNETALTSGWCVAKKTKDNEYYDRYLELEGIAKSRLSKKP